jgi:hypothetical protein
VVLGFWQGIPQIVSKQKSEMEPNNLYSAKQDQRNALEKSYGKRISLIFHLKINDFDAYGRWLKESKNKFGSRRLFRVKVDPVPRGGMEINEIVIDEYSSSKSALEFISNFEPSLKECCSEVVCLKVYNG